MKPITLTEVYNEFNQWSKECSGKLPTKDRNKLAHLVLTLDTAITNNQQSLEKDNIKVCLETIHRLKNFTWPRCKDEHLLAFLDFLTSEEVAILLGVHIKTIYTEISNIKRRGKKLDLHGSVDIESIQKMTHEEFQEVLRMRARLTQLEALGSPGLAGIQVAKEVLIGDRNQRVRDVEAMWALVKEFLAWITGEFIPALMKKISHAKWPFDVKVLVAEVLNEKYKELVRKYQEVKPKEETPWDEVEKKAKRRGKLKPTRKIEEKEAKLLKASGSIAPIDSAEPASTFASPSEEDARS